MQSVISKSAVQGELSFQVEGLSYQAYLFDSCHHPMFTAMGCDSLFQSRAYHAALESAPPEKMHFWYVRLQRGDQLAGILCFQIKDFNPGESLRNHAKGSWRQRLRYKAASLINLKVLCLGNTLVTGDYGFCFQPFVPSRIRTLLMMRTIDWMLTLPAFKSIHLVFVKDFYQDIFKDLPDSSYCRVYHPIDTQPSMIMKISDHWHNLEGYLSALKSKYRIRAHKAIEVAKGIERVELNAEEIEALEDELHQLYLKVMEDAGFNLFILAPGYFTALKKQLGDAFRLWIYKRDGELISFFTVLEDGEILDAHFLGYDPEVNHAYKLYLNMLLSMIDHAAANGFKQLQLSRTATEIKSSVGAEGVTMWSYMRAPNRLFNALVPWLYSFFKPDLDWVARQPFRE